MITVLLIAVGFLLLGHLMGASWFARGALLGVLFGAVFVIQTTLPDGHALRQATGGSLQSWALVAGAGVLVGIYVLVLRWLKARVPEPAAPAANDAPFSASELQRYARHIVLREIGGPGQQKLKAARVLVMGAGGLGSPVLLYLAAAGVGTIGVVDDDEVSLSNLQRQVLHDEASLGRPKVASAEARLKAINPHVRVQPYEMRLDAENAAAVFADFDLILDGTDNFATRHLVNATAVTLNKPLIAGAISQWEGQVSLYHPGAGGPCYACVFPEIPAAGLAPTCAEIGVMGALPGVVGSMMAVEAIKWITGAGTSLMGEVLVYDALYGESRKIRAERRADCAVCGANPAA
ncbi:MAG: molybdopterin-synthase adenylyltransferase MoeB [Rhodobacteraceae bacterium]|nr:molybdopterin-synthase adenylyltransferase MoeB [Paracoccaceae bacterium]